jgi:hypothetical protein
MYSFPQLVSSEGHIGHFVSPCSPSDPDSPSIHDFLLDSVVALA